MSLSELSEWLLEDAFWCDQAVNEGMEVAGVFANTWEAWLRRVRAATRAPLHLGQGQGWRHSGMGGVVVRSLTVTRTKIITTQI